MFRRLWRRYPSLVILASCALVTSPCWGGFLWIVGRNLYVKQYVWTDEDRAHTGEGHPSDARKWRAKLATIPNLDAAERDYPELVASSDFVSKRYPNGEWLFGIATDSHRDFLGIRPDPGGTVVLKDSRGQVRVFYGHICGAGRSSFSYPTNRVQNLDQFYAKLVEYNIFVEQFLTPDP
jgi:hypothetical protein